VDIVQNPELGEAKKGDLLGVYVYKFDCINRLYLLAYEYDPPSRLLCWSLRTRISTAI
jgi:hypothetical protein